MGNRPILQMRKHLSLKLFPMKIFRPCRRPKFNLGFVIKILLLLAWSIPPYILTKLVYEDYVKWIVTSQFKVRVQLSNMTSNSQMLYTDHSLTDRSGSIPATVRGWAKNLLDPDGNILNGLDFPMWKDAQWGRRPYATDMVAWEFLLGKAHGGAANTPYPTGHMRWGLAGTAHAVTMLHMDSDGFATFVQLMCGKKLWALYRPNPELPLSNPNALLDSDFFQLDNIPLDAKSGLEAVVLRPGDMLYVLSFFHLVSLHLYTD